MELDPTTQRPFVDLPAPGMAVPEPLSNQPLGRHPLGYRSPGSAVPALVPFRGFWEEWQAGVGALPAVQGALTLLHGLVPEQPGYSPFDGAELKGYEDVALQFTESRSPRQTALIKARLDDLRRRRETIAEDGTIPGQLLVELANPINWTPFPLIRGLGMLKGGLMASAAAAPILYGEERLRARFDPYSTQWERTQNLLYGTLFAGVLGGAIGGITRARGADPALVGRLADEYRARMDALEQAVDGEAPVPVTREPPPPGVGGGGRALSRGPDPFELDPITGEKRPVDEVSRRDTREGAMGGPKDPAGPAAPDEPARPVSGVDPVIGGFHETVRVTAAGRLWQSGSRALQDLALMLAGDFGVMMKQNRLGEATPGSVFLKSQRWRALAGDLAEELQRAYSTYLTGQPGRELAGINLTAGIARAGDIHRRARGVGRPDGKWRYDQFKEQAFAAHKKDRMEHPDPHVMEAAMAVRRFFEQAEREGLATGALRTKESRRQLLNHKLKHFDWLRQEQARLTGLPRLTPGQEVALRLIEAELVKVMDTAEQLYAAGFQPDTDLARKLAALDASVGERAARAKDRLAALEAELEARRQAAADKVAALDAEEAARGLTPGQRAYRDGLVKRWGLDGGEAGPPVMPGEGPLAGLPEGISKEQWLALWEPSAPFGTWLLQHDGPVRLNDALDWLAVNGELPGFRELAAELRLLNLDVEVRLVDAIGGDRRTAGMAWHDRSLIELSQTWGVNALTVLHEAVHMATGRALELDPALQAEATRLLGTVQDAIAGKLVDPDVYPELFGKLHERSRSTAYGLSDMHELFTEGLTNPRFQQLLRRIAADGSGEVKGGVPTVWDRLVELIEASLNRIKQLMGQPPLPAGTRTALDELLSLRARAYAENARLRGETPTPVGARGARDFWTPGQRDFARRLEEIAAQPMSERMARYRQELEAGLAGVPEWHGPKGERHYLPHVFDVDRVIEDEQGPRALRQLLFDHFMAQAPDSHGKVMARVDAAIRSIIAGSATRGHFETWDSTAELLGGRMFHGRKIDLSAEELAPWLVRDVELLARDYAHRFGVTTELHRMFGERSAADGRARALIEGAEQMGGATVEAVLRKVERARADIDVLHGFVTGDLYLAGPDRLPQRRLAQTINSYGRITSLHNSPISALVEVVRPLMIHGFGRVLGHELQRLAGGLADAAVAARAGRELRLLTGEGLDVALSAGAQRWIDDGSLVAGTGGGRWHGLDKWLGRPLRNFGSGAYFILNGLAPITDLLKRHNMVMTAHFLLEDLGKLADGAGDADLEAILASYGLSRADAERIGELPIDAGRHLRLPDFELWPEDLADKFSLAVAGLVRRTIVTAGPADVPELVKGFWKGREYPLLTLPMQFMSWGFAANQKMLISALQGRDRSVLAGAVALVMASYASQWLRTKETVWRQLPEEEKLLRAVEGSGLLAFWQDIPSLAETFSNHTIGIRPALGLRPRGGPGAWWADVAGEAGGPGIGKLVDIVDAFTGPVPGPRDEVSAIRRAVPLTGLPYWRGLFDAAQKGATEALGGAKQGYVWEARQRRQEGDDLR
jgi:hypothetical protein